mmetsp:Transcript_30732/g.92051  ORF Transcript_30732/g.92051 Transcript_30732/m.92051 type:complete len:84 (-) Transcript_30732:1677-1928(-)
MDSSVEEAPCQSIFLRGVPIHSKAQYGKVGKQQHALIIGLFRVRLNTKARIEHVVFQKRLLLAITISQKIHSLQFNTKICFLH